MAFRRSRAALASIAAVAVLLALGACTRAGTGTKEDEEPVQTEVVVQVGTVARADLRAFLEAYGTVEPEPAKPGDPGGGAKLAAPVGGIIRAVHAIEGQRVAAGDMVIQLDDRIAQAAADKARHAVAFAEAVADRQDKLYAFQGTSMEAKQQSQERLAQARAELAAAQAAISQVRLASPLDGVVARIFVHPGQTVDLNTVVAEVIDLRRLVATINVPVNDSSRVNVGQKSEIFSESGSTPATAGHVLFVSPAVDPKTGSVLVRLRLPEDCGLRPGQFIRARIVTKVLTNRLVVPRDSIVTIDDTQVIYIVEGNKALQKPVKAGLRDGDLVEVEAEGLKEGDKIVTVGAYGLPKETRIKFTGQ